MHKISKRICLVLALLLLTCLWGIPASAEDPVDNPFEWRVFFSPGFGYTFNDELNDELEDAGYDKQNGSYGSSGIGFIGSYKGFMFGLDASDFGQEAIKVDGSDWEGNLEGQYGLAQFGYKIIRKNGWQFYPLIGLGTGQARFLISDPTADADFEEILAAPGRSAEITTFFLLTNISLCFDYRFNFFKYHNDTRSHGLVLGMRAGYNYAPVQWGSNLHEAEISKMPDMGLNGPYAKFIIGWGGGGNR